MTDMKETLSIDEELAIFTDQLIDEGVSTIPEGEDNEELKALAETAQRLYNAFDEEVDPALMERIRKKTSSTWLHPPLPEKKATTLNLKKRFTWKYRRSFQMAASFAMLLLILALSPSLFSGSPTLAGSASSLSNRTVIFALFLFVFIATVFLWVSKDDE